MEIGIFKRFDDGEFSGKIRTLTLNFSAHIREVNPENDKAPNYVLTTGGLEFGKGWSKKARDTGQEYISIKIDDPSFAGPIYATLVWKDDEWRLIWLR